MKNILYIFILLMSFSACSNLETDDKNEALFGNIVLAGRTYFVNNITGSGIKTVKKSVSIKMAFVGTNAGTDFDAIATSNDDGYYIFNNVTSSGSIRLFGSFQEEGITFQLDTIITGRPSEMDLIFTYDPDYAHGLRVQSLDANGSPVPAMNYYLYNNLIAFNASDTSNAIQKNQLNQFGKVLLNNLQPGTYYIALRGGINNVNYQGSGTVQYNGNGITDFDISVTSTTSPGLTLIVQDVNGTIVTGAKVCLFTSGIIFSGAQSCDGSVVSGNSDATGKVKFPDINPLQYFVLCKDTISNIPIFAQDTIVVPPATAVTDTITVQ